MEMIVEDYIGTITASICSRKRSKAAIQKLSEQVEAEMRFMFPHSQVVMISHEIIKGAGVIEFKVEVSQ